MTAMRPPQVAGIAGGVGTTVIATLIGAVDAGVWQPGDHADVLVCRSVAHQLAAITRAAATIDPAPVVVIVADCDQNPPSQARDRARMLEPNVAAVVWFPWLAPLREATHPAITARDAACAAEPPRWARVARTRRDTMIAAVAELLTDPAAVSASPPPVRVDDPTPPARPAAAPAVSPMRPRPRDHHPAPAVDSADATWPGVRPDAPRPAPPPRAARPSDADALRRTS